MDAHTHSLVSLTLGEYTHLLVSSGPQSACFMSWIKSNTSIKSFDLFSVSIYLLPEFNSYWPLHEVVLLLNTCVTKNANFQLIRGVEPRLFHSNKGL